MTDNEIVKAWGKCLKDNVDCAKCPLIHEDCHETILNLINRQKAEIERLKTENKLLIENNVSNKYPNCVSVEKGRIYTRTLEDYDELIGDISAEAYKEFAERFKALLETELSWCECVDEITKPLDNLLKELVGDTYG